MPIHREPARILVVDDDPATLSLLTAYLVSDGHEVVTAGSEPEALDRLVTDGPQLVLLDLLRPPHDRSEVCRRLKDASRRAFTPLVASADAATLVDRPRLHEAGVDDFVSKPYQRTELLLRVGSMLRSGSLSGQLYEKTQELRSAKALLLKQATTDPLTGLHNKSHFELLLRREIGRAGRRSDALSMVVLAVDGLRRINQGHGHTEGDRLLRRVADAVRECGGEEGCAARYGDKRFVLLLPRVGGEQAREVARDLKRQIQDRQKLPEVDLSVNVTSYPDEATDQTDMLQALERGNPAREGRSRDRYQQEARRVGVG